MSLPGRYEKMFISATTRRWNIFSNAAVHFPARSEAVTDQRVLRFSACLAGVQICSIGHTTGTTRGGYASTFAGGCDQEIVQTFVAADSG